MDCIIDFKGKMIKSYIDGSELKHFPSYQRSLLVTVSSITITAAILVVIGIVTTIYVLRYMVLPESSAQTITSVANSVQIQITNLLYGMLATALTDLENYRYGQYNDHDLVSCNISVTFSFPTYVYLGYISRTEQRQSTRIA